MGLVYKWEDANARIEGTLNVSILNNPSTLGIVSPENGLGMGVF